MIGLQATGDIALGGHPFDGFPRTQQIAGDIVAQHFVDALGGHFG